MTEEVMDTAAAEANEAVELLVFEDENGQEKFYAVSMAVELENGTKFGLLSEVAIVDGQVVPMDVPDMFVARLGVDESGNAVYDDPTDEEFAAVMEMIKEFQDAEPLTAE